MKNITVSVSDDLYRRARVKAAEQDTTVSAVVREHLEEYAAGGAKSERARQLRELLDQVRRENPGFRMADNLTREELHDRQALRRH